MEILDADLLHEIEQRSGEEIHRCYQCKKCSTGCPMSFAMDVYPHQIIRLLQYGLEEEIWKSETLWICASCEACGVRCPNEINIAHLMDALRQIAVESGKKTKNMDILTFHRTFLNSVKKRGRIHEVSMLAKFKIKTMNLTEDLMVGWDLFRLGKLPLKPHSIKGRKEIRKIFEQNTPPG